MTDKYQKLTPGQKWRPNAALHNDLVDMAQERNARISFSQQEIATGDDGQLRILNSLTTVVLRKFSVVGIGEPITGPNLNEAEFKDKRGFESATPAVGEPFAILQDSLEPGTIGPALMAGVSQVLIDFSDVTHKFAAPSAGDYDKLASNSGDSGGAEILWANIVEATTLDGAINASVTAVVVDNEGFPDQDFVVTIGTEDLLVTAVLEDVWTVTRGHGGTTAASHADGAAVTFKSGTVWAVVRTGQDWQAAIQAATGQFFKVDSATRTGKYYPAHRWVYEIHGQTWTEAEAVWLFDPNENVLGPGVFYPAVREGGIGTMVPFLARVYTADLGQACTRFGNTITANQVGSWGPWDGVTPDVDDRILLNTANLDYPEIVVDPVQDGSVSVPEVDIASTQEGDGISVPEIQSVIVLYANGGTFTLTFDDTGSNPQTTAAIAFGASAGTVQSTLLALPNTAGFTITVTGTGTDVDPYLVTLEDPGFTDFILMVGDPNSLTPISLSEIQSVAVLHADGGTFTLWFDDGISGYEETVDIPYGAAAAVVEAALQGLANTAGFPTLTVTGAGTLISPYLVTLGDAGFTDFGLMVGGESNLTSINADSNGIWKITVKGDGATAGEMERTTDFDEASASEVATGALVNVTEGTVNANTLWVLTTPEPLAFIGGGCVMAFAKSAAPGDEGERAVWATTAPDPFLVDSRVMGSDLNPLDPGPFNLIELRPTGDRIIHAISGGIEGRRLTLRNYSATNIIRLDSVGIVCPKNEYYVLEPGDTADLYFYGSLWHVGGFQLKITYTGNKRRLNDLTFDAADGYFVGPVSESDGTATFGFLTASATQKGTVSLVAQRLGLGAKTVDALAVSNEPGDATPSDTGNDMIISRINPPAGAGGASGGTAFKFKAVDEGDPNDIVSRTPLHSLFAGPIYLESFIRPLISGPVNYAPMPTLSGWVNSVHYWGCWAEYIATGSPGDTQDLVISDGISGIILRLNSVITTIPDPGWPGPGTTWYVGRINADGSDFWAKRKEFVSVAPPSSGFFSGGNVVTEGIYKTLDKTVGSPTLGTIIDGATGDLGLMGAKVNGGIITNAGTPGTLNAGTWT